MADFKIQRGIAVISAASSSVDITAGTDYDAPSSASSAYLMVNSTEKRSLADMDAGGHELLSSSSVRISFPTDDITSDVRFTRDTTNGECWVYWEITEYTGEAGGDNEFIVRDGVEISYDYGDQNIKSSAITGIVSRSDCIPYLAATATTESAGTSCSHEVQVLCSVVDDAGSDKVNLYRETTGGPNDTVEFHWAFVWVVEYTGSNWTVQSQDHTMANKGNLEDITISSVGDISRAALHPQVSVATWYDNDRGIRAYIYDTTTVRAICDAGGAGTMTIRCWVLSNSQTDGTPMSVQRVTNEVRDGGQTDPDTWTKSITSVTLSESSVMGLSAEGGETYDNDTINVGIYLSAADTVTLDRAESMSSGTDAISCAFEVVSWPTVASVSIEGQVVTVYYGDIV